MLDPFGYTTERRHERKAIDDYKTSMRQMIELLDANRLNTAIELAKLPQTVRGYGHVKDRNAQLADAKLKALTTKFQRTDAELSKEAA